MPIHGREASLTGGETSSTGCQLGSAWRMAPTITVPEPQPTAGVKRVSRVPSGHRSRPGGPLPDGPRLGALAQGTWFHRDPVGMTERMQGTYGDLFTLRMPVEGSVVVVCAPEATGQLLASDPSFAHAGEGRQRILGMVAKRSVLGADDVQHRESRGRVRAVFERDAIHAHAPAIAEITSAHVSSWPRGRPVRLLPLVRALCDEIFARCVVGVRDAARAAELGRLVQRMLWTPGNPPMSPPGTDDGVLGQLGKVVFARRAAPVRELLSDELRLRRRFGDLESNDLLGAMLRADGLTDDERLDEILPLLMAGQEPPAAGLTWLLDRLARTPALADEIVSSPTGERTDAIRRETLRLTPAVAAIMRRLMAPTTVAGVELPGGTMTMLPIAWHHHDPRVWGADASEFRPDRFLTPDGRSTSDHATPGPLFPFGGGERRCLGEHLAHLEMDVVLPAVFRAVSVRPLWPSVERPVVRGTVLVPHRSTPVVLTAP